MRDHLPARFEAIEAGVAAGILCHVAALVDDFDPWQIVAFPGLEVVGIVRRRHLDDACAELGVGEFVEDHGDLAVHQRQHHRLAVQIEVARVFGIYRHRCIAQHGFGASCGHYEIPVRTDYGVANVPQMAGALLVFDLQIRKRCVAGGAPVHHVLTAIDEAALPQPNERLPHGAREA